MNDNGWEVRANGRLKAAKRLAKSLETNNDNKEDDNTYDEVEAVCALAEGSAKYGLAAYLLGVGAGLPKSFENCDLIRLGAEVRAEEGKLPPDLQAALRRLSAYQDLPTQSSVHPAGRTTSPTYEKSDADNALKDAEMVINYVSSKRRAGN